LALIERETPELKKLRRLTQPDPLPIAPSFPEAPPTLPPDEEEKGIFSRFTDAILDAPLGPPGGSIRKLGESLDVIERPFQAFSQLARKAGDDIPALLRTAISPALQGAQLFRRPEEERQEFQ